MYNQQCTFFFVRLWNWIPSEYICNVDILSVSGCSSVSTAAYSESISSFPIIVWQQPISLA